MVGITVLKLWLFGGNSNNGSNCGLANANSNNAWTNSNANISARLTMLSKTNDKGVSTASWEHTRVLRAPAACAYVKHVIGRNNIHLARKGVSSAACDVSKPLKGI